MIGDKGRETSVFAEAEDLETPVFYSGRPILASDLNESLDRQTALREKALVDVIGHVGFPRKAPGFAVVSDGDEIEVNPGRMYVSGACFGLDASRRVHLDEHPGLAGEDQAFLIACCDKAERDFLDFPYIRDDALGGPDTAGRRSGFVRLKAVASKALQEVNETTHEGLEAMMKDGQLVLCPDAAPRDGKASFALSEAPPAEDNLCHISQKGGYNRRGNFNYLVQIHKGGPAKEATFKWARDDIRAGLRAEGDGWVLTDAPQDDERRFGAGNTIEVRDARQRAENRPGVLGVLEDYDPETGQAQLSAEVLDALKNVVLPLTITRWHQPFDEDHKHGVLITDDGLPIHLENNATVAFTGTHHTGDFWYCAARVRTGALLWPPNTEAETYVPPFNWGPRCVGLASFEINNGEAIDVRDLRPIFPDLTHLEARDVTISGIPACGLSAGMTVQQALDRLCMLTRDSCAITVRPDQLDPDLTALRPELEEMPTLSEALELYAMMLAHTEPSAGKAYNRRLAIRFTQGEYTWDFDAMPVVQDVHSLALTACTGAPVVLNLREWLTADRCLNVVLDGMTVKCTQPFSGVSTMGGKSVEVTNCLFRRSHDEGSPILKLSAKRRITLRETRVNLDIIPKEGSLRPAIQIVDARAQVLFENVSSNGSVITGPILPKFGADPSAAILFGMMEGDLGIFGPVNNKPHKGGAQQSGPTFRLTGCKLWRFLPDALMMEELLAWSSDAGARITDWVISVADHANRVVDPETKRPRFDYFDDNRPELDIDWARIAADGFVLKVTSDRIAEYAKTPFRSIEISDSEFKRGNSIFVAQTVSIQSSRFTQFGPDYVDGGNLKEVIQGLPFGAHEWNSIVYKGGKKGARLKPWYSVGMVVSKWSSLEGNMGFPEHGRTSRNPATRVDEEGGIPLLVNFSRRPQGLSLQLSLSASTFDIMKHRLVTLYSGDIIASNYFDF
ncbi:hypothetical protein [Pacificoceanicola onchidii]|uniref:hypothetical protein n=1 Tax=Pacificoceanicola onchidii TaxID=2562685 RepID=UPI0010A39E80|nr:hypothetical protein [Pacificoceanicola onchidii]